MRAELKSLAQIVSTMQETAIGIRIVKSFNLEDVMRKTMTKAIRDVEKRSNKIAIAGAMTGPLMESLGGFAIAGVIVYGGWNVIQNGADAGGFFSFITAMLLAYEPAKRLARLNVQLHSNIVAASMLYEILDQPIDTDEASDAAELLVANGQITLNEVSFSYGNSPALNNISLDIQPNGVTALVGPSGGGKSTVFALIERFYDPTIGSVLVDSQDLRKVSFESLRRNIALVTQDTFLFDGTIRDNIAFGKPNASEDEVIEAAQNANAHEFISILEAGYDTPVGEGGGRLSGGQRQRIAIARAMLRDAPILLLDEPTSALDAQSEHKVQEALDRLMENRTTVVIAHRLSTVRNADKIYVMEHGEVLQSGSHSELISQGGLYAHLCALQFREPVVKALASAAV